MKTVVLVAILATLLTVPVSAFYVPSDGSSVNLQVPLGDYYINASGTYTICSPFNEIADAEWIWRAGGWEENYHDVGDLMINDSFFDWLGKQPSNEYLIHALSETHEYQVVVHSSGELRFRIADSYFGDNEGGLNVEIVPVPEPSSFLAIAGGIVGIGFLRWRKK